MTDHQNNTLQTDNNDRHYIRQTIEHRISKLLKEGQTDIHTLL